MLVTMIGVSCAGLASGACFADFGRQVTCVDKDGVRIEALRRGEIAIFGPGLFDLVDANTWQGRAQFATDNPAQDRA